MSGPVFKPMVTPTFNPVEPAPLVSEFHNGAVFKGYGNSHFTCENGRFHETTEVPGMGQGMPVKLRFDID